jgi:hypothetical protein
VAYKICYYDPVELVKLTLDSADRVELKPWDRLLAELVATFNCCLVCSCMMLKVKSQIMYETADKKTHTEHKPTWLGGDFSDRIDWKSCAELTWARRSLRKCTRLMIVTLWKEMLCIEKER